VSGGGNRWRTEIRWAVAVPEGKGSCSSIIYKREVWVKFRLEKAVIPLVYVWEVRGRLCGIVCIIIKL
jgi:hypothetical protein